MNKVLITGASGLLGRALVAEFTKHSWEVLGLAYSRARGNLLKVDLNDAVALQDAINKFKPHVIIHSAAERSPDKIEKNQEAVIQLNIVASKNLAKMAGEVNALFLYISTDYVFDGTNPPYKEDDIPNPLNQYGVTKFKGEKEVRDVNPDCCILRIPVLYGDEEYLGESAISVLIRNFHVKTPVKVSNFEIRFPSHTTDIAVICLQIVEKKLKDPKINSTFHWCGEEAFTKYEMLKEMAHVFALSSSHLVPDDTPSSGAPRPKNTQLSCNNLKQLGIGQHTKFADGIHKSFKKFFENITKQ